MNEYSAEIVGAELRKDYQGAQCVHADVLVTLRMSSEAYRGIDPTRHVYLTQENPDAS